MQVNIRTHVGAKSREHTVVKGVSDGEDGAGTVETVEMEEEADTIPVSVRALIATVDVTVEAVEVEMVVMEEAAMEVQAEMDMVEMVETVAKEEVVEVAAEGVGVEGVEVEEAAGVEEAGVEEAEEVVERTMLTASRK
jgi:hypothetical protein